MNKWDTIILNNGLKCILLGEEIRLGASTGVLLVTHSNKEFVCNIEDVANHIPRSIKSSKTKELPIETSERH
jgi:hypothetical protein